MSKITDKLHVLETSLTDIHDVLESKLPIGGGTTLPEKLKVSEISSYIEQIDQENQFKITVTGNTDDFNGKECKATNGSQEVKGIFINRTCVLTVRDPGEWTISNTLTSDTSKLTFIDTGNVNFEVIPKGNLSISMVLDNSNSIYANNSLGLSVSQNSKNVFLDSPSVPAWQTKVYNKEINDLEPGPVQIKLTGNNRRTTHLDTSVTIQSGKTVTYNPGTVSVNASQYDENTEGPSIEELLPNESIKVPIYIEESETNE